MEYNKQILKVPRMRTIKEVVAEIKRLDSDTALTEWRVRKLINEGVIPCVKAGKRQYINLDLLIEYLQNPFDEKFTHGNSAAKSNSNGIRPIY